MDYLSKFKKLDLKTKKMISWNLAWNFKSAFKWRWLEFDEFREYESWEDSRYIDWLVSAREQRLLTKRFAIDKSIKVFFVLDVSKSMEFGFEKTKVDTLIESFFLLALSSIENWDDVWAVVLDENNYSFFDTKKWKANVFDIYKRLIEKWKWKGFVIPAKAGIYEKVKSFLNIETNVNKQSIDPRIKSEDDNLDTIWEWHISLNFIFSFLNKIRLKNCFLFILTDKMNVKDDKNLKILALKNDVVFVNIFDTFENTLETTNENSWVLWFMSSLWKGFFIDNLNTRKRYEYKELRKRKIKDLFMYLTNLRITYLKLDNKSNIYKDFFNLFAKK